MLEEPGKLCGEAPASCKGGGGGGTGAFLAITGVGPGRDKPQRSNNRYFRF